MNEPATVDSDDKDIEAAPRDLMLIGSVCIALGAAVALIYAQTARFDFVNYDDNFYVYENPHVLGGLSKDNLVWAFTEKHASNWHPLTWVSHMLDVELFGKHAAGPHMMNVLIHAAAAMLLFIALRRLTGEHRPSAFVAAVFAVHPLRVESVAWVAERKDVLSGLFFALILLTYASYVRRRSVVRYSLVMLTVALGLMAKPTLVTVPFVLLLLDYWPLGRLKRAIDRPAGSPTVARVILEKAPLLALVAASCVVTLWAQREAIPTMESFSPWARLANAANSYLAYIRQLFWPSDLAVLYPLPEQNRPVWEVIGTFAILLAMTTAVIAVRRSKPYLLVGWFWYLGMLVPVIGLVQVGVQAHADRYTYLSQIGLVLGITWWLNDLSVKWPARNSLFSPLALGLLVVLSWCSWRQTRHWHDSIELFSHALACTSRNAVAHNNLGVALTIQGQHADAAAQFEQALAIAPNFTLAKCNYGVALVWVGRYDEAAVYLQRAYELAPTNASVLIGLGMVAHHNGKTDESEAYFEQALAQSARPASVHNQLGFARVIQKQLPKAVIEFRESVRLDPDECTAWFNLGLALYQSGQPREALAALREALRLRPDYLASLRLAAWVAATSQDAAARSGADAVGWSERAVALSGGKVATILDGLAASYAEAGRFPKAVETAEKALTLAAGDPRTEVANKIRAHLAQYRSNAALREPPSELD